MNLTKESNNFNLKKGINTVKIPVVFKNPIFWWSNGLGVPHQYVFQFELRNNNETVQKGNSEMMLWKIDELISHVSQFFTLKIGDIIFTGTPAGVAAVKSNDVLEGFLEEKKLFRIQVK